MNLTVKDCYWLSNDFQNQFISREVYYILLKKTIFIYLILAIIKFF